MLEIQIISFFINLLFGVICAIICDNKNRTVWKGFLAGFFLGVFGIAICWFLDKH